MSFYTYILFSKTRDKFYIGSTSDNLEERLGKHNTDHRGFTGRVGDWKIVYYELYLDKTSALKREMEIKRWKSRKLLEKLVGLGHPDL